MRIALSLFLLLGGVSAFAPSFAPIRIIKERPRTVTLSRYRPALLTRKTRVTAVSDLSTFVISNLNHNDAFQGIGLLTGAVLDSVKDAASLGNADETLQIMIKAVDVGPGSENLQKLLSTLVNTPGLRQVLQVVIPPLSIVVTEAIQALLPTYIVVLDAISKTGGHEGLLPDGIDVTMRAVQRLAAQGEIIRAFKVLQAGQHIVHLSAASFAESCVYFWASQCLLR